MSKLSQGVDALRDIVRRRREVYAHLWSPQNVKVVAYELARLRAQSEGHGPAQALTSPPPTRLSSSVCSSRDWSSEWLPYWAGRIGMKPVFHRKLWEFAYISQVLSQAGMLGDGVKGLGFGCGKEPLASLFVRLGCDITATDLAAADARAQGWSHAEQHAGSLESIWMPSLCSREEAIARLHFQAVDMNAVPRDFDGKFDFCWSSCALEHLGSIEQGLAFIRASARCLRPGGIGVHTTELNIDPGKTLQSGPTVLFQMRHFERLSAQLAGEGIEMLPILATEPDPFLDGYVDIPPYPEPTSVGSTLSVLHLRLLIDAYRSTSIGIVIRNR